MRRFTRGALALVTLAAACSGESTGPPYEEYIVGEFSNALDASASPTIVISETVFVGDTASQVVQGGLVRFTVTSGTTTPALIATDAGGLARVTWTLTAGAGRTDTISACASNSPRRCDTYHPVFKFPNRAR
jgi:hypothetical protein